MNDFIRKEDAIDAITKLPVKVDNLGYTWMIAFDVFNQIDDIPSVESKPKWIPVTKSLPEKGENVLVTVHYDGDKYYDYKPKDYVITAQHTEGTWFFVDEEYLVHLGKLHVIAWMPLPKPYKGD